MGDLRDGPEGASRDDAGFGDDPAWDDKAGDDKAGAGRRFLDEVYGPGARDQRLELFAQGRWADKAPGSGWLALQVGDVSRPEILCRATEDEILGIGRSWKALETWTFARKLGVVRELIRRHPLDEREEPGGLPGEWEPRLHHEVAAALGISTFAAGKLVHAAWMLVARLPGIGQALEAGRLDPGRVRLIIDGTSVLEDERLFAKAERIILDGLAACKTWSALERLVQRAVTTVDPDGAQRRREAAEREHARLRVWREHAGTFAMQATGLPADEALAADARINGRARQYKAAMIDRPMDVLRVMAFADLVNDVTLSQRVAWAQSNDAVRTPDGTGKKPHGRAGGRSTVGIGSSNTAAKAGSGGDGRTDGHDDTDGRDNGPGGTDPGGTGPDGADPDGGGTGPVGEGPSGGQEPAGDWDDGEAPEPPESPFCGECGGRDCRCGDHGDAGGLGSRSGPCAACLGAGGGSGLPVRASLTVPAGALEWLAKWSAEQTGNATRGPTGNGARGGSPGGRHSEGLGGSCRGSPGGLYGSGPHYGGPGPCPQCRPWEKCRPRESGGMAVRESLALPLLTVFEVASRPGEAHGLGALDPGLVRDLTAAGARHPGSQFCITVTDSHGFAIGHGCCRPMRGKEGRGIPVDPGRPTLRRSRRPGPGGGHGSWILTLPGAPLPFLVDIDPVPTYDCDHRFASARHDPGAKLRHLVQVRDGKCSFPACTRQARESDWEHARPFEKGGATCACNAHACSRSCHRAKQSSGWQVTKPRPGWTRWTTGAGRVYLQGPWKYPA